MKSIAHALKNLGLIETIWTTENCKNGSDSIVLSTRYYNGGEKELKEELRKYNEIDCKVMQEIVAALKNN